MSNYSFLGNDNKRLGEHYQRYQRQEYSSSNQNSFSGNNYINAYDKQYNEPLSVKNEPIIEYDRIEYYLTISSRDRDRSAYPDVNKYIVNLPVEFRNVASIELIQAIIPDKNSVTNEPYLLLKIDEMENVMISNDKHMTDAFAVLQLSGSLGGYIQIDKRIHENTVKEFRTPLASLGRVSVSITKYNGELFSFGTDNVPPTNFDITLQNTFVFKIVCLEKRRAELNYRSVY